MCAQCEQTINVNWNIKDWSERRMCADPYRCNIGQVVSSSRTRARYPPPTNHLLDHNQTGFVQTIYTFACHTSIQYFSNVLCDYDINVLTRTLSGLNKQEISYNMTQRMKFRVRKVVSFLVFHKKVS